MLLQLDGLLFYHKRSHYTFGPSPLVVWLKAYMMPEILGISVPEELLALAPSTYTGFSAHAETVRQKKQDKERQTEDGKTKSCGDRRNRDENSGMHVETYSQSTDDTDTLCDGVTVHVNDH